MKNKQIYILILFVGMIAACKPQENLQVGEPFGKVDGIKGAWKLKQVNQVDESAKEKNSTYQTRDLVSKLPGLSNILISFATDENNNPTTIQFNNPDEAPVFGFSATHWTFDNIQFPSAVIFTNDAGTIQDSLKLLAPVRSFDQELKMKFSRYCDNKPFVTYEYIFQRQ